MGQIGTYRIETASGGVVDVPVFELADVEYDFLRVELSSGTGAICLRDPQYADLEYLRVETASQGTLAVSSTARFFDGIEDGDLKEWTFPKNGDQFSPTGSTTYEGDFALEMYYPIQSNVGSGNTDIEGYVDFAPRQTSGPCSFYATSNSAPEDDVWVYWEDANGNRLCKWNLHAEVSGNIELDHKGGTYDTGYELPTNGSFLYFVIENIDYANNEFDWRLESSSGSVYDSGSGFSFLSDISIDDVAQYRIETPKYNDQSATYFFDNIEVR